MKNNELQKMHDEFVLIQKRIDKQINILRSMGAETQTKKEKDEERLSFARQYIQPHNVPQSINVLVDEFIRTPLYNIINAPNNNRVNYNVRQLLNDLGINRRRYSEGYRYYCKIKGQEFKQKPKNSLIKAEIDAYLNTFISHSDNFMSNEVIIQCLAVTPIGKYIRNGRQLGQYMKQIRIDGREIRKERKAGSYGYYIEIEQEDFTNM